jgi:hypothetical protein
MERGRTIRLARIHISVPREFHLLESARNLGGGLVPKWALTTRSKAPNEGVRRRQKVTE